MKKHFFFNPLVIVGLIFSVAILSMVNIEPVHSQTLSDITGDYDQYGVINPGIMCKTRTNNEASVRNLAHGVKNNS